MEIVDRGRAREVAEAAAADAIGATNARSHRRH
jgi:hypothetical protein